MGAISPWDSKGDQWGFSVYIMLFERIHTGLKWSVLYMYS